MTLRRAAVAWVAVACVSASGCGSCGREPERDASVDDGGDDAGSDAALVSDAAPPDGAIEPDGATEPDGAAAPTAGPRCPVDMVRVAKRYCVDRFEARLVDVASGRDLSPYYPPARKLALFVEKTWEKERFEVGDEAAHAMPLPRLPDFQRAGDVEARATSRRGVWPSGYVSGERAQRACTNAGKRLCTLDEWRTACRGEQDRQFPYGTEHEQGRCNMFREGHPAAILHGDASKGHLDPRLNQVRAGGKPLLRRTGDTPACVSTWEDDGIYDMVGNLDEWIDDPEGTFVGGFYSRAKKDGCDSTITGHPFEYQDYSTGVRCCADGR